MLTATNFNMNLKPFKLERYFAKYEFSVKYLLSSSDCDGLVQKELVELADSETRTLWEDLKLGYTESLGHPLLRSEVANLYKGITSDNVLIVAPEEGMFIALNTILEKGDHVICTFPGYQSLYEIAEGLGCEVTKWQPEEENGWRFNPEFLRQNIKANTKLIIVNFPHNPTGYLPSVKDYEEIVNIAKEHNLYLFSDEMYRFLELNQSDQLPSACETYDKAISLFGMSKTFGMAGVRIGWVVTKDKNLYDQMAAFKDYTTICSSAPSEILSIIALRAKEKIVGNHLKRIERNLKLLDDFSTKHQNLFEWVQPKAGTIGFPKLKGYIDSLEFCQKVVNEAGIMLLPSTVYDYDNKHFRIGFGRENMPEALKKLEDYIGNNT
ncbi:MAG: Aminotransferase [Candidatus Daviesbacteria bacterium GW2011_GWA2_38_24]|uniref:Aminotransferase n=1 Tax=Candidatus Daviesbacteria bacterium GW2011_GWA2_38_24 TaxID=1618422 RepID=A0A0G0LZW9_9BACT|nr:MAG: Aminotransferase [Candidatus Daviesbacteria bacterium GW2011_GWA2_38_24]KKQ79972.1 MAG: Aminotransferase [Candidatus Daviesbacteria bacterium GW2011_GWA1_38_7]